MDPDHAGVGGRAARADGGRPAAPGGPCRAARTRDRARSGSGSPAAACAAPTCTSPTVSCRHAGRGSCPGTRSSARSMRSAPGPSGSPSATGSGCPGSAGTDGTCRFCRRGEENLCLHPRFTGWDVDGGYADACLVDEAFAYRAADGALRRAGRAAAVRRDHRLPRAAVRRRAARRAARHLRLRRQRAPDRAGRPGPGHARCTCCTRGEHNRGLARQLGADSVGGAADAPPEPLDGAILFAPAGDLVPVALRALDRGGTLAVAGIWLSDDPGAGLRRRAVPGAAAAQRHRQHPAGRRGVPPAGRPARRPRHHRRLPDGRGTRWRSPTWPHGRFSGAAVLHN